MEYILCDSTTASHTPAADMFVPSPPLPSPPHPPPPSNNSFHIDQASRIAQWTYRVRCRSHPSRIHLQLCAVQSSSAHYGSQPNHVCVLLWHPRHSWTRMCGQTHTTCCSSVSSQTSTGPRYMLLPLDLLPPPSSVFPTIMSTSRRESSPFYLLVTDPENDAHVTQESIDTLLDMVNHATAEFSTADHARIKWYCMENGDIPTQDRFKLLLAAVIPLYGQVFSNHSMDEYIPNYRSHAISVAKIEVGPWAPGQLVPHSL